MVEICLEQHRAVKVIDRRFGFCFAMLRLYQKYEQPVLS